MVRREVGQFVGERFFSQIPSTFLSHLNRCCPDTILREYLYICT